MPVQGDPEGLLVAAVSLLACTTHHECSPIRDLRACGSAFGMMYVKR